MTRYIIFEEKRYFKAYLQTKDIEVCTPAEFFNINAVRETPFGSVIMFRNAQVGILVKLERGTVIGRPQDFEGEHYDALSDMYRELLRHRFKFLILDICESTGSESTLDALGRLTVNSTNKNINKLMELQVGYMRSIVNDTIYSKDYLLIYTDASRVGSIIQEASDCLRVSLAGAIDGFEILDQNGISTFVSEYFGVGLFSGEEVLKQGVIKKSFKVIGAEYTDGVKLTFSDEDRKKLEAQVRGIDEGRFTARQVSLRKALSAAQLNPASMGLETEIPVHSEVLFAPEGSLSFGKSPSALRTDSSEHPKSSPFEVSVSPFNTGSL